MAPKKTEKMENPSMVVSSSEEEEEEVSGSSDDESGEDEEQISKGSEENKPKDSSSKTLKTPSTATKQSSDSDSGSEADSDSEAEPSPKATAVSPVKSKQKETAVKSGMKRASEGTSTDVNAKKAKMVSASGEENKKAYFQRLWTEEDEVSLLQGMIDYKADTGKSPYDDMNGFFDLVKKAISFEVIKVQFCDKIRGLKKKYLGKLTKGKEATLTKAHDKKCFKLAKLIWGSDGLGLESAVKSHVQSKKKKMDSMVEEDKERLGSDGIVLESAKSNVKVKNVESLEPEGEKVEEDKEVFIHGGGSESPSWFEKSFLVGSITSFGVDEQSVKQRWSKVPVETKKRIEEKLKLVQAKEFELMMLKMDVLSDATSVISEAI